MKVTLRTKPISGGRLSLYLDYYPAIKHPTTGQSTRREFLEVFIYADIEYTEETYVDAKYKIQRRFVPVTDPKTDKPKKIKLSTEQKTHNDERLKLAEKIKARRLLDIDNGNHGFLIKGGQEKPVDFLAYFFEKATAAKQKADREGKGGGNNWIAAYHYLARFAGGELHTKDVTESFCTKYRDFLLSAYTIGKVPKKLSVNSACLYFNTFKSFLRSATKEKLFTHDPAKYVDSIKPQQTQREFFTLEEMEALNVTDCAMPELKAAALFSASTGLRYSDIEGLRWEQIVKGQEGYNIRFTIKKTGKVEYFPVTEDAYAILGVPAGPGDRIFKSLNYSDWQNDYLKDWIMRATGKEATFHAFRHTFATLLITLGEDIYTVSQLLGHRAVKTTQIYAHLVDQKKRSAVNKISFTKGKDNKDDSTAH